MPLRGPVDRAFQLFGVALGIVVVLIALAATVAP